MPIVEVPFTWGAFCLRPKARIPSLLGVIDRAPAMLRDVDEAQAPVAARYECSRSGTRVSVHVPLEWECCATPPLMSYRAYDGSLWRPVGGVLKLDPDRVSRQILVGSDFAGFAKNWLTYIRREGGGGIAAFRDAYVTILDLPALSRRGRYTTFVDEDEFLVRTVIREDHDVRRAEAVAAAERSFVLIGGVLHCRTPGPAFVVENLVEPAEPRMRSAPDAVRSLGKSRVPMCFRADNVDMLRARAEEMGAPATISGAIHITDGDLYAAHAFNEDEYLVHQAACILAWHEKFDLWFSFGGPSLPCMQRLQLRDLLEQGAPSGATTVLSAIEDLVRRIDAAFPVETLTEAETFVSIASPVADIIAELDWRRQYRQDMRDDKAILPGRA